ncbi:pentapeptide repeat-containing protein [Williamsoniiplasma lucivorax]|uniref:Pentapeptide repeat-containing protein n=1 Tax=Williamsoniiplasma lucivorax TaxID=209274 RepID=A0A2S5RDJ9_9MOLU|nr:pentapeptide repeat-containing protein [Williamsoniiplasma lucivorax]PPE05419.1 hypothetical protein ELUCI_v1c05110 [Williamsoniiplasma lucivorax]
MKKLIKALTGVGVSDQKLKEYLKKNRLDLRDVNLKCADLRGVNLLQANLSKADLRHTDLKVNQDFKSNVLSCDNCLAEGILYTCDKCVDNFCEDCLTQTYTLCELEIGEYCDLGECENEHEKNDRILCNKCYL